MDETPKVLSYGEQQKILEEFAQRWLDNQKDTLLIQLIGHMSDEKAKAERQYGSAQDKSDISACS